MTSIDWPRVETLTRGEETEATRDERREAAYYLIAHGRVDRIVADHVGMKPSTIARWRREWGM